MNKVLLILLAATLILAGVSCVRADDAKGDSSESTDKAVTCIDTDDTGEKEEDRATEDETQNFTAESDSADSVVTKTPDEMPNITYEDYINMTAQQQTDFIKSFSSVGKFTEWYNAAKSKYDIDNDKIYIGEESIDLGDIFNK